MKKLLALILALVMVLSFAACGGGNDEPVEPDNGGESGLLPGQNEPEESYVDISDTSWLLDDVVYLFYADGSFAASDGEDAILGTYDWDGTTGYIHADGSDIFFAVYGDGELYIEGEDGNQYLMEYVGAIEDEPVEEWPKIESTDQYDLYEYEDGTYIFNDKVRNVSYSCPNWMTVILGGVGETTDGVVVGDNAGGYVVMDNVTDEWVAYDGYSDEFLFDYVDAYMGEFYYELYELIDDLTYEELEPTGNELAAMELNIWSTNYDIQIVVLLLSCDDGSVIAVSYFADYDDDAQLDTLYNSVTGISGPLA